ncbi:uncharacterized protein BX663DRAFT_486918 [Cokeromyces recurvatus]|uniref:uncharacterized protein n=1 Tax=Cokeromyces recurvatus TaxID=90255 RepID=UPI002221273F|nr:uncharacterized protein BX663DRAFT_486918 [Cokeromyces recurvatus]KAI7902113.1 hypothetical protein BX663DRAFT_486918 [Cokeromyces recurvatus]
MGPSELSLPNTNSEESVLFPKPKQNNSCTFLNENNSILHDKEVAYTPVLLSSPFTTRENHGGIQINSNYIPTNYIKRKASLHKRKQNSLIHCTTSSSITRSKINKKGPHELLSEDQKRANHIASEQKRRANIRIGFEKLVEIVPTLSSGHRSEALILQKSIDHLKQLADLKTTLKAKARELQLILGEIPDEDSSEGELDNNF